METLSIRQARRLALARAGLLKPAWSDLPARAAGRGRRARAAAQRIIERFGYLQLDTVSVAGARSHTIVLLSRLQGFDPALGEQLLQPGAPLFEYWGHEASWIPIDLHPAFEFRRREFRRHPWWGDVVGKQPEVARDLIRRIRDEGPLRSVDMEGPGSRGWWDLKIAKKVATALWSSGELAIRERRNFQRTYDLAERVIPEDIRAHPLPRNEGLETLLLKALEGHGWATTGLLVGTWRLRNRKPELEAALHRLQDKGRVIPCDLAEDRSDTARPAGKADRRAARCASGMNGTPHADPGRRRRTRGWIRPDDLELVGRLETVRPRSDQGVLLSPFDPLLWDRARVQRLFGFDQVLEIFKPSPKRIYGYYCLPVLAGERLVARVDLKAERSRGVLRVLSRRFEGTGRSRPARPEDGEAFQTALARYSAAIGLRVA